MARAAAGRALGRRPQGRPLRHQLYAESSGLPAAVDRRVHDAGPDRRGVPIPQRVDAGEDSEREASGHALDLRRRLQRRLRARWRFTTAPSSPRKTSSSSASTTALAQLVFWFIRNCRRNPNITCPVITACSIRSPRCSGCRRTSAGSAAIRRTSRFSASPPARCRSSI